MNEQDYNDLISAIRLLTGIVGRKNLTQRAREELKKNVISTEIFFISPASRR